MFEDSTVLITGGSGSLGNSVAKILLNEKNVKKIIIYSRDENKHYEMAKRFDNDDRLRFFIGDVRDKKRLERAFRSNNIDYVFHLAAMKRIEMCCYNPSETIQTNITGAQNVIDVCLDYNVKKAIYTSTDKSAGSVTLYGSTKSCAEHLWVNSNSYSGSDGVIFLVVRYGNVINSKGSVLHLFREQAKKGLLTITDHRMTRFIMTLDSAARFVISSMEITNDRGEIFVPKAPSVFIIDLATAIAPLSEKMIIGFRSGEKMHEVLIAKEESRRCLELNDRYVIYPDSFNTFEYKGELKKKGKMVKYDFEYSSKTNNEWILVDGIKDLLKEI